MSCTVVSIELQLGQQVGGERLLQAHQRKRQVWSDSTGYLCCTRIVDNNEHSNVGNIKSVQCAPGNIHGSTVILL